MKPKAALLLSLLLALPLFAQAPAPDAVTSSGAGHRLVIGAAGTVQGVAQRFQTQLMVANFREEDQLVRIDFLRQGVMNTDPDSQELLLEGRTFFPLTVPWEGLGSLVIRAVDSEGAADENGRLSAIARIYSADACGEGTVSQSFKAETVGTISGGGSAYITGLSSGTVFRSNIGIVNLHPTEAQTFTIHASGQEGRQGSATVTIAPMSMTQVPLPQSCVDGTCTSNYGELVVTVDPEGTPGDWFAYGSSVHNRSGDAWVSPAIQLD